MLCDSHIYPKTTGKTEMVGKKFIIPHYHITVYFFKKILPLIDKKYPAHVSFSS